MDSQSTGLWILYHFWNVYMNDICLYKQNLGRVKDPFLLDDFHAIQHKNTPKYFLTSLFLQGERTFPLRLSRGPLGSLKVSSRSRFHLRFDIGKTKLSMSKGLNIWLNKILGHCEMILNYQVYPNWQGKNSKVTIDSKVIEKNLSSFKKWETLSS